MKKAPSFVSRKHPLGSFGLLLILLVAKSATYAFPSQQTPGSSARAFLARRVIDGIAIVGWMVDRLSDWTPGRARDASPLLKKPDLTHSARL
jgi:hypothetical protein